MERHISARSILVTGIVLLFALLAQTSIVQGSLSDYPVKIGIGYPQNQITPTVEITPMPNALGLTEAEIKAGQPTGIIFGAILLVVIIFVSVLFRVSTLKIKKTA